MMFQDRSDAGKQLAQKLLPYKAQKNTIVLGLARGGVVIAYEIAKTLSLPFNVLVPRKIGAPNCPELAIGAVAEDGQVWLNKSLIQILGLSDAWVQEAAALAKQVGNERLKLYRKAAPLEDLKGKTVLLIDDGIATGATMLAEIQSLRKQGVKAVITITPVASKETWNLIRVVSDEAIALLVPENLQGISQFYINFGQVEDETVLELLKARR